ncbi:MAG: T9SS type A sorting domain-containing protein [Prevotellaceae bacterium]|nr:T9SS type A sorting domain-containing protein [Prevotellaceae bacterium]
MKIFIGLYIISTSGDQYEAKAVYYFAGTYTFTNITDNHSISVTFKPIQYTITVSAGANGTITPATNQTVACGDSQTFTFTSNAYYETDEVLIDGVHNAAAVSAGAYTFTNVTDNHSIEVSFKLFCIQNLVVQVWGDVLSVINNPANNGGYTFISYQWQENGMGILGETGGNLYLANNPHIYTSSFSVRLTTADGIHILSCPVTVNQNVTAKLRAYPNPTRDLLRIESGSIKSGDMIEIYNITGYLVRKFVANTGGATISVSVLPAGTYILKINKQTTKFIKVD